MSTIALGDVVDVSAGQPAPPSDAFDGYGTPFIRAGSIEGLMARGNWHELEHLSDEMAKGRKLRLFPQDTVLFAKSGMSASLGRVHRIDRPAYVVSHLAALRPIGKADPAYLTHWLTHFGTHRLVKDPAYPSIRISDIEQMPFPDVPLAEQKRIAAMLDQADALRRTRRDAADTFDRLANSVFHEMFGDVRTNDRGWPETLVLADLCDVASGITKGRKLNGKTTRPVPYMTVATVQDGFLKLDAVRTIEATDNEIERYRLRANDILLTEGGDPDKLGRGALWNDEIPECIHQNHVFRVRIRDERLHPTFAVRLLGSARGKSYFLRSAKQTTGIASINSTQLKAFPLLLPPIDLQNSFAARVDAIAQERCGVVEARAQSESLFASLQQRAFKGEV